MCNSGKQLFLTITMCLAVRVHSVPLYSPEDVKDILHETKFGVTTEVLPALKELIDIILSAPELYKYTHPDLYEYAHGIKPVFHDYEVLSFDPHEEWEHEHEESIHEDEHDGEFDKEVVYFKPYVGYKEHKKNI